METIYLDTEPTNDNPPPKIENGGGDENYNNNNNNNNDNNMLKDLNNSLPKKSFEFNENDRKNFIETIQKETVTSSSSPSVSKKTKKQLFNKKKPKTEQILFPTTKKQKEENEIFLKNLNSQLSLTPTLSGFLFSKIKRNIKQYKNGNRIAIHQSDCKKSLTYTQFLSQIHLLSKNEKKLKKLQKIFEKNSTTTTNNTTTSSTISPSSPTKEPKDDLNKFKIPIENSTNTSSSMAMLKKSNPNWKIGFFLPSFYLYPGLILMCLKVGIKVVILDPITSINRLRRQISTSKLTTILTIDEYLFKLESIVGKWNQNKNKSTLQKIIYFKNEDIIGENEKDEDEDEDEDEDGEEKESDEKESDEKKENNKNKNENENDKSEKIDVVEEVKIDIIEDDEDEEDDEDDEDDDDEEEIEKKKKEDLLNQQNLKNKFSLLQIELLRGEELFLESVDKENEKKSQQPQPQQLQSPLVFENPGMQILNEKKQLSKEEIEEKRSQNLKKANETAIIIFSAGKKIIFSHKNLIASILQTFDEDDEFNIFEKQPKVKQLKAKQKMKPKTVTSFIGINLFSIYSLNSVFYKTLLQFGTVVIIQNPYIVEIDQKLKINNNNDNGIIENNKNNLENKKEEIVENVLSINNNNLDNFKNNNNDNNKNEQLNNIKKFITKKDFNILSIFKAIDYWKIKTFHLEPETINKIVNCQTIFERKYGESLECLYSTNDFLPEELKNTCQRKFNKTHASILPGFQGIQDAVVQMMKNRSGKLMKKAIKGKINEKGNKKKKKPLIIKQVYGVVETCSILSKQSRNMAKFSPKEGLSSVGCPVKGMTLKIEENLILFKGPTIGKQYYLNNKSEQNGTTIENGWVNTKDVGFFDKNINQLFLERGRAKEVIKFQGISINELELEKLIKSHPLVEDACVVAEPSKEFGELPVGYIVLKKKGKIQKEQQNHLMKKNKNKNGGEKKKGERTFELKNIKVDQMAHRMSLSLTNSPGEKKNGFKPNFQEQNIEIEIDVPEKAFLKEQNPKENKNNGEINGDSILLEAIKIENNENISKINKENSDYDQFNKYDDDHDEFDEEENFDFEDEIEQERVELLNSQTWNKRSNMKQIQKFVDKFVSPHERVQKIKFVNSIPKDSKKKLNFKYKLFNEKKEKPKKGGYLYSIINLMNGAFGAGILTLPYAYHNVGLVPGILATIFYATVSSLTQKITIDGALKCKKFTYQEVIKHYLGGFFFNLLNIMISTLCYGICSIYIIIIGNCFSPIMTQIFTLISSLFSGSKDITNFIEHLIAIFSNRYFLMVVVAFLVLLPLSLFKEMRKLGFFSSIAIVAIFYVLFFLSISMIIALITGDYGGMNSMIVILNTNVNKFKIPMAFIALPMITNAYNSPSVIIPIMGELKNRNKIKGTIITFVATYAVCIVYIIIGISGYFLFGSAIKEDFLLNFPKDNIGATIGRISIGLVAIFSFPVLQFVGRLSLKSLFSFVPVTKIIEFIHINEFFAENVIHFFSTVVPFLCILIIAVSVPQISIIMGFIGSVSSTSAIFFFPGLLCWKVYRSWKGKVISILLTITGVVQTTLGLTNCITSLFE